MSHVESPPGRALQTSQIASDVPPAHVDAPSNTTDPYAHNPVKVAWRRVMLARREAIREVDAMAPEAVPRVVAAPGRRHVAANPGKPAKPAAPAYAALARRVPKHAGVPSRAKAKGLQGAPPNVLTKQTAGQGDGRDGLRKVEARLRAPAKKEYSFLCCGLSD